MVLAGPGSGKTLVITWRVRWLIEQMGIHPGNILIITFTRAAAAEMKKRFQQFEGMKEAPVTFGTFHSVFFMILRYAYHYTGASIVKEEARRRYIRDAAQSLDLEMEDENDFISNVLNEISYVKGEMISLDYYHSAVCSDDVFAGLYQAYEQGLRRENLIDFDDMLVFCHDLLKNRSDILSMWQQKFRYILIDEFQDINRVQYQIVKMLAGKDQNLFIVGDDDQSIYRFRGAKPEIMLGFQKDFPEASRVVLDVNYRSSAEIVESSRNLILHNSRRFEKEIKAVRGSKSPVTCRTFENVYEECMDILKAVAFYQGKGIPLEEMAVIYRTNTQPRQLLGKLMEFNIPFQMRDMIPNVFDHWISRNIMAYLRLALGERDRGLFLQIMNRPKRYISRNMLDQPTVSFTSLKRQAYGKKWLFEKIDQLEMDLTLIRAMEPYEAIQYIRRGVGYEEYLKEYALSRNIHLDSLTEVLDEVTESARDYHSFEEWFAYIEDYGEELARQAHRNRENKKGLTLTTMHSSKGLEYEVVFVIDSNEGVTPHKKAVKEADLEEERRLYYVAMTRAKTYLFLYSVKELYQKEVMLSRYIGEIRYDRTRLKEGQKVNHRHLGPGTILHCGEGRIRIRFDRDGKVRIFHLSYLLEKNLLEYTFT